MWGLKFRLISRVLLTVLMYPGEVTVILRMDYLIATPLVAHRQHGPKRMSGASPFYLRTSTCGRAHWPFLTQNSFVWLHLFSSSLLTGPFLVFFLLPSVPSLLLDGIWSYTHNCCLLVSVVIQCAFHAPEPVCLLAAFLYFLLSLLPPHGKCWLRICLHQRKCMWKPPCPSCMLALFCSHIFTDSPWGRFAIST